MWDISRDIEKFKESSIKAERETFFLPLSCLPTADDVQDHRTKVLKCDTCGQGNVLLNVF